MKRIYGKKAYILLLRFICISISIFFILSWHLIFLIFPEIKELSDGIFFSIVRFLSYLLSAFPLYYAFRLVKYIIYVDINDDSIDIISGKKKYTYKVDAIEWIKNYGENGFILKPYRENVIYFYGLRNKDRDFLISPP